MSVCCLEENTKIIIILRHKKLLVIESASYHCNFTGTVINSLTFMIVCKCLCNSVLLLVHYKEI